MKRLDIKAAARRDLQEVFDYSTDQFGEDVAVAYLSGIRLVFARILDHPNIGEISQAIKPSTRIVEHRSHRIYYRRTKAIIEIIRVLHRARDATDLVR